MNRSHRFPARALAAFLIVIQGFAGGAIAAAHSEAEPFSTAVAVTNADDSGSSLHGDVLCPLCLVAGSHAQQAPGMYVTAVAAIASPPLASSDDTPRATPVSLTSASPRAPPATVI